MKFIWWWLIMSPPIWGGDILILYELPVCLSVRPSVRLSVCLSAFSCPLCNSAKNDWISKCFGQIDQLNKTMCRAQHSSKSALPLLSYGPLMIIQKGKYLCLDCAKFAQSFSVAISIFHDNSSNIYWNAFIFCMQAKYHNRKMPIDFEPNRIKTFWILAL